jgi:hypothetical protein
MILDEKKINQLASINVEIIEKDLLDRIQDRYRWPYEYPYDKQPQPSIECINPDGTTHRDFFNKDGWVDSKKAIDLYQEGYTLIISRVHTLFPSVIPLSIELAKCVGKEINGNAYFSKGTKSVSFGLHNHYYPVLVKNVYGKVKWIVGDQEVILQEQDTLFFKEYTDHQVVEIIEPRLSITFNLC